MNREIAWMLLPIVAFLWQAGGTWKKQFRRIGFPVAVTLTAWAFLGFSWWWIGLAGASFGVTTLPFTLLGDGIPENPFNWIWIWIYGVLLGAPAIVLGIATSQIIAAIWLLLVPAVATGIVGTFSNIPATRGVFPWKFCEGTIGFFAAYPYALLIQQAV